MIRVPMLSAMLVLLAVSLGATESYRLIDLSEDDCRDVLREIRRDREQDIEERHPVYPSSQRATMKSMLAT